MQEGMRGEASRGALMPLDHVGGRGRRGGQQVEVEAEDELAQHEVVVVGLAFVHAVATQRSASHESENGGVRRR